MRRRPIRWACPAAIVLVLAGCASPLGLGEPRVPRHGPQRLTYDEIEAKMRSAADSYLLGMAQAYDVAMEAADDPSKETVLLGLKSGTAQSTVIIATGPNPVANFVDLAANATLRRQAIERHWIPTRLGAELETLAVSAARQEQLVWESLADVADPQQLADLRELIDAWREANPDGWYTGATGMRTLKIDRTEVRTSTSRSGPTSIFSLLLLDPLAGLDPAAQEVELTRRFADRVMYGLQRQPMLLSWQTEHLLAMAGTRSTGEMVLGSVTGAAAAMERYAAFLEGLPEQVEAERVAAIAAIGDEREAAIEQLREATERERTALVDDFFDRMAEERSALMRDLSEQEGAIIAASTDLRETIRSGTELSESLTETAGALESLASRFESENASGNGPPGPSPEEIREMLEISRATVEQLTGLAERVERIVASPELKERISESDALAGAIDERLRGVVDHAFGRGVWLVVIAVGAWVVGAVALRLAPVRRSS